jgi:hypothetical protein
LEAIELHWGDYATFHATTYDGYFKDLDVSTALFQDPEIFQICVPYSTTVFDCAPLTVNPNLYNPFIFGDYFRYRMRNGCVEFYNPITDSYHFDRFNDMIGVEDTGYVLEVSRNSTTGEIEHQVRYLGGGYLPLDIGYTIPRILFGETVAYYVCYPNYSDGMYHLEVSGYWRFPILDLSQPTYPPVQYPPPIDPSSIYTAGFWRLSFILEYQNFSLSKYSVAANKFFSGTVFIAGAPSDPPIVSSTTNSPISVWRSDNFEYPCWEFKRTSEYSSLISPLISTYSLEFFYNGEPVTGCLPWKSW